MDNLMASRNRVKEFSMGSLLRIHPRFMRSVHLERDFADTSSSAGYVVTPVALAALSRIRAGFRPDSTQRAFRVAGDYGSGKSAFGLALARVAAGYGRALPPELRSLCAGQQLQPKLATGDHEPLGITVLRAIGVKVPHGRVPSTAEVLDRAKQAIARARAKGFKGILLVLDELGKNLEYAAQRPDCDDIFLLQRLAEEAARSGTSPLVVVVMLHQGVAAYASRLDTSSRREWDKVAARFEEIIYAQPLEQTTALMAATLNVDLALLPRQIVDETQRAMKDALRLGVYGTSSAANMSQLGPRIFPIHPSVPPVLVRAIRKFGQNERSLFSFISASEPMGLQHHLQRSGKQFQSYRLPDLFDYVRQNLLTSFTSGSSHVHWGVIDALLASISFQTPEEESVVKAIALLTLLDAPDLPATHEFLHLALNDGSNHRQVSKAMHDLKTRGLLYERGTSRGLCLWPHTSVNLDEAFDRAVAATRSSGDPIEPLCQQLPTEQIVPRGHYFRWGTLRYAEVQYHPATALKKLLESQPTLTGRGADLHLKVLLPANRAQLNQAQGCLRSCRETLAPGVFFAVAQPPVSAVAALADLLAWKWVKANTAELAGDRYAREEVARQIARADSSFRERLGGLDSLDLPIADAMTWFHNKGEVRLRPGRELLAFLGGQCDDIYWEAPRVLNELINRRIPSSAAVAARTKLAEAMTIASDKPMLGMDQTKRPPEMALYLSILQEGGFHVESKDGWLFQLPSAKKDTCNLLPALKRITNVLQEAGTDALVSIPDIFAALSSPPFGIREGLQPFILAIYLATHHQRVALYEDGSYLPKVKGEVFLRLMKEPQFFHIQYCEIKGVRADVFTRLLELLRIDPRDASKADLIDLIRPLTVFISSEVPEFSRKTNNLSAASIAVRRALLEAREPVKLVFTMLPEACGLPAIDKHNLTDPDELAVRLRAALHEIRAAYSKLIKHLSAAICAAFDVPSETAEGRKFIADRAIQLLAVVTEPSLRAFALRLADSALDDRAWTESIANLLARKSCERWIDSDETEFHHQLEVAAGRFKRTELALLGTTKKLNGHAFRIAITKSDGTEVGDLLNWEGMDENRIRPVEGEIQQILTKHGRHGLAAVMRAVWTQLNNVVAPPEK
ncbi:MAG: hypothetical protein AB9869_03600 [Verrucomicrobiia bacterium]